jgi:hypothetical protein
VAARNAGDAVKSWYGAVSAMQMRSMDETREQTPAFTSHPIMRDALEAERSSQSDILRDIFGNPFRPAALSPAWRTPTVVALAQAAYDNRALPGGRSTPHGWPCLPTPWKKPTATTPTS